MSNLFKAFPFHPVLFAIYPGIALLAVNIAEVEPLVIVRPLFVSLILAVGVYLVLYLWVRNWARAAALTSFVLILFFSYGHAYHFLEAWSFEGFTPGRHRYLVPGYGLILLMGLVLLNRRLNRLEITTQVLNLAAAAALLFPFFQLAQFAIRVPSSEDVSKVLSAAGQPLRPTHAEQLPDIYFIVLDTYTRADALSSDYNFDNRPFIRQMEELGFFVAECSRTNYGYTQGAITASLNLNFLHGLGDQLTELGLDSGDIWVLLKQSLVRTRLEEIGYTTVAFETGYEWSRLADADVYLGPFREPYALQMISPFESLLIKSTAGLILTDSQVLANSENSATIASRLEEINFPYRGHVERQLFILDQLEQIPSMRGPKFVFAHLLIPHEPFVFDRHGEIHQDPGFYSGKGGSAINDLYHRDGYIGEIQFINDRMIEISKVILAQSDTDPIILILGDHGVKKDNRLLILNAYYLPGDGEQNLYPSISPVNSFRVIFDTYFGTDYGLLPDLSYQSDSPEPAASEPCLQ